MSFTGCEQLQATYSHLNAHWYTQGYAILKLLATQGQDQGRKFEYRLTGSKLCLKVCYTLRRLSQLLQQSPNMALVH